MTDESYFEGDFWSSGIIRVFHLVRKSQSNTPTSSTSSTATTLHLAMAPTSSPSTILSHKLPPSTSSMTPVSQPQFVRPFEDNFQSSPTSSKHSSLSPSSNLSKPSSFPLHPPIITSSSNDMMSSKLTSLTDSYKHPLVVEPSSCLNSQNLPLKTDYYNNLLPQAPGLMKTDSRIMSLPNNISRNNNLTNMNSSNISSSNNSVGSMSQSLVNNDMLPTPPLAPCLSVPSSNPQPVSIYSNNHSSSLPGDKPVLPSPTPSSYPYILSSPPSNPLLSSCRVPPLNSDLYNYHSPILQHPKYPYPPTSNSSTATSVSSKHKPCKTPLPSSNSYCNNNSISKSNCNNSNKFAKQNAPNSINSSTLTKINSVNKRVKNNCKVNSVDSCKANSISSNNNSIKVNNNLAPKFSNDSRKGPVTSVVPLSAAKTKPLALDISNLLPSSTNSVPLSTMHKNHVITSSHGPSESLRGFNLSTCNDFSNSSLEVSSPKTHAIDPTKMFSSTTSSLLSSAPVQNHTTKIISRLDQAARKRLNSEAPNLEDSDDFLSDIFLTKGPPDKLDAPPRKLRFLAVFGLTTLAKRNDLELNKLARRRAAPTVEVDFSRSNEVTLDSNPQNSLNLPHPTLSRHALPNTNEKLTYMEYLELQCVSQQEKQEYELIWHEILAERRRRKAVTPLVLYCSEDTQPVSRSPLDEETSKWSGIEDILISYHDYAGECKLERAALKEQVFKSEEKISRNQKEIESLELQLKDLQTSNEKLKKEKSLMHQHLSELCSLIEEIRTVTSST